MNRVAVVGAPGSGKSSLAAALADRLGTRHVEEAVAGDRWVVDGNDASKGASEVVWPRADTIVWLDLPRRTCVRRVWRRTFGRSLRRTELWGTGNRESLRVILARDSLLWFAWRAHRTTRRRYEEVDRDRRWVRLRTPREVRRWFLTLPSHDDA